jgi:hypothetical protein
MHSKSTQHNNNDAAACYSKDAVRKANAVLAATSMCQQSGINKHSERIRTIGVLCDMPQPCV